MFTAVFISGCFLLFCAPLYPSVVRISIFNEHFLSAVVITPHDGEYIVSGDREEVLVLKENDVLYISRKGEGLFISSRSGSPGIFESVSVRATAPGHGIGIRPLQPSLEEVLYHGDLYMTVNYGRISMINETDKSLYLAGVVEAESGTGAAAMYYKAQAVICRTYLYNSLHRHADEGFDLCDEVHCQAYKGRMTGNKVILEAVKATSGKVITCEEGKLIPAVFHANCGGQTASSDNVWLQSKSCLQPVTDPWCRGRPGSLWQKTIDASEWKSYLVSMGFNENSGQNSSAGFDMRQQNRSFFYRVGDFAIPYRKIRADWNLRSAYFDIETAGQGSKILIRGRGYGHGAGLCQEGAMVMAVKGYNFIDILQFYYTGISIADIEQLF